MSLCCTVPQLESSGAGMQTYVLVCMQCTGVGSGGGGEQASAAVPDSRVPGLRGSRFQSPVFSPSPPFLPACYADPLSI